MNQLIKAGSLDLVINPGLLELAQVLWLSNLNGQEPYLGNLLKCCFCSDGTFCLQCTLLILTSADSVSPQLPTGSYVSTAAPGCHPNPSHLASTPGPLKKQIFVV